MSMSEDLTEIKEIIYDLTELKSGNNKVNALINLYKQHIKNLKETVSNLQLLVDIYQKNIKEIGTILSVEVSNVTSAFTQPQIQSFQQELQSLVSTLAILKSRKLEPIPITIEKIIQIDRPVEIVREVEVQKPIEVPVQKQIIVEVEKVVEIEKIVEVEKTIFVEKIVEIQVEKPVFIEKIVQIQTPVVVERIVEEVCPRCKSLQV